MNYTKIYNDLIGRAQNRSIAEYTESHHIIPKCLGGSDVITNLVELTPEEHFVAHVLLVKIHRSNFRLIFAVNNMSRGHKGKRANRKLYGWLKRKFIASAKENQAGKRNSQFGSQWISNPETKENRKILVTDVIPDGFVAGRNAKLKKCTGCGTEHYLTTKWCDRCSKNKCKGSLNSQFGLIWITDGSSSKKISKDSSIPEGWEKGRVVNSVNLNQ